MNEYHYKRYDEDSIENPPATLHRSSFFEQGSISTRTSRMEVYPAEKYIGVSVVNVSIGKVESRGVSESIPMVARVSIIDYHGQIILDTYVRPTHSIEGYREAQTGLSHIHLFNAPLFVEVQQKVAACIQNKILVGHRIWIFLSVLGLSHSAIETRDLALFRPMRKRLKRKFVVELSTLVEVYMGRNVGFQYEDSLESSRAAMDLFCSCQDVFEDIIASGEWPCDLPPSKFADHYS